MLNRPITAGAAAGKLHLLDLADMKRQMGDRWARMADPVERFFEGAVRRNLGPGDTFLRQGELCYILLFRNLSPEEAQVKCRTIAEEVCERLFGDEIQRASLRNLVMPLETDGALGGISAALDEMLEHKGREIIIQIAASKAAPPAPDNPAPPETDAPVQTFLYRPIWDASKNVVITYLCQSAPDAAREAMRQEDAQARTDQIVLQECTARTRQLHQNGLRILTGVTVHLDTLSHSRLWTPYSKLLKGVAPAIARDFAFFVSGIDNGVPNIRLAQELPKLARYSRQIFCIASDRGFVGARFARTGAHAIGIMLMVGETEAAAMARITELAYQAAEGGLAGFVLGVPSTSLMLHALGQGIRYLEGPVIRPAVSDPRHAFSQSLEYVYAKGGRGAA